MHKTDVYYYESCPLCYKGDPDGDFCHMVCVWILGSRSFVCNGSDVFEDKNIEHLFPRLASYRGSRIVILFRSEFCNHFWFSITEFHKGQTRHWVEMMDEHDVEKLCLRKQDIKEMWRD